MSLPKYKFERIVCPVCCSIEKGTVWDFKEPDLLRFNRIHCCRRCNHLITHREWDWAGPRWWETLIVGLVLGTLIVWLYVWLISLVR